jgi:hypothetical protein
VTRGSAALRPNWLIAIRRYLVAIAIGNLLWETAQMPLYTLWRNGSSRSILWAVLHCTGGDLVIATVALTAALGTVGSAGWPRERHSAVAVAIVAICVGYTVFSEYLNTVVRQSWAYSEWMPIMPWIGTGAAPLAQWVVVPAFAYRTAAHSGRDAR